MLNAQNAVFISHSARRLFSLPRSAIVAKAGARGKSFVWCEASEISSGFYMKIAFSFRGSLLASKYFTTFSQTAEQLSFTYFRHRTERSEERSSKWNCESSSCRRRRSLSCVEAVPSRVHFPAKISQIAVLALAKRNSLHSFSILIQIIHFLDSIEIFFCAFPRRERWNYTKSSWCMMQVGIENVHSKVSEWWAREKKRFQLHFDRSSSGEFEVWSVTRMRFVVRLGGFGAKEANRLSLIELAENLKWARFGIWRVFGGLDHHDLARKWIQPEVLTAFTGSNPRRTRQFPPETQSPLEQSTPERVKLQQLSDFRWTFRLNSISKPPASQLFPQTVKSLFASQALSLNFKLENPNLASTRLPFSSLNLAKTNYLTTSTPSTSTASQKLLLLFHSDQHSSHPTVNCLLDFKA